MRNRDEGMREIQKIEAMIYEKTISIYKGAVAYHPSPRLKERVMKKIRIKRRMPLILAFATLLAFFAILGTLNFFLKANDLDKRYAELIERGIRRLVETTTPAPKPLEKSNYLDVAGFLSDVF
ncbi:MAG: hypothetical protein J7L52_05840 [Thermotogae bacterium]|nr:hypothetical protein [Thermotogota bacterium]